MGTQTKIAAQIIEQEGDYALALKDNQGNLFDEVKATFVLAEQDGFGGRQEESVRLVEKGHGRLEIREYWMISQQEILAYLDPEQKWKRLRWDWHGAIRTTDQRRSKQRNPLFPAQLLFRQTRLLPPSEVIGGLKTACIGSSMSRFGKMTHA